MIVVLASAALVGGASAQTLITDVTYQFLGSAIGTPPTLPADPNAAYSNVSNSLGGAGPGTAGGTPPATTPIFDDFTASVTSVGRRVTTIRIVTCNTSANSPVRAITQFGLWNMDGLNGGPQTPFSDGGHQIGYVTTSHDFQPGFTLVTLTLGGSDFAMPSSALWAGLAYKQPESSVPFGYTSISAMGYQVGGVPSVGTTAPGGGLAGLNGLPFGLPVANFIRTTSVLPFAMEFVVPSPSCSAVLCGAGLLGSRRRR